MFGTERGNNADSSRNRAGNDAEGREAEEKRRNRGGIEAETRRNRGENEAQTIRNRSGNKAETKRKLDENGAWTGRKRGEKIRKRERNAPKTGLATVFDNSCTKNSLPSRSKTNQSVFKHFRAMKIDKKTTIISISLDLRDTYFPVPIYLGSSGNQINKHSEGAAADLDDIGVNLISGSLLLRQLLLLGPTEFS